MPNLVTHPTAGRRSACASGSRVTRRRGYQVRHRQPAHIRDRGV